MNWYKKADTPFIQQLMALRSEIVIQAQQIYDDWELDNDVYGGGGICDRIAEEIGGIISMSIPDVEVEEGGQEGDDHNWVMVRKGNEIYGVDIPYWIYERGGGYSWTKIPGIKFNTNNVDVWRIQ